MNFFSDLRKGFARFARGIGRGILFAALLMSVAGNAGAAASSAFWSDDSRSSDAGPRYLVIENVGQFAAEARFTLAQGRQRVWLTDDALWLVAPDPLPAKQAGASKGRDHRPAAAPQSGAALRFTFPGANMNARPEPFGRAATHISYLIGNDPAQWQQDVPAWEGVRYRDLYPAVDLVVGGDASGLIPWRLEAQPGADLTAVALKVEGADAASAAGGQLQIQIKGRTLALAAPSWTVGGQGGARASDVTDADRRAFRLAPAAAAFSDESLAEVAAPNAGDLIYSRLAGGSLLDSGYGVAVDYAGNAYVTGETASSGFPTVAGSYDTTYGGATDAFVAKYNAGATSLVYATFLGGSQLDLGLGVAVSGNLAYVVGETSSPNFPGGGTRGESDIFAVSLNATGTSLRYATLIGGADYDMAGGIAMWGADAYLVGSTDSTNLAGIGCAGISSRDMVVARLGATGAVAYTRCYGGSDLDAGYGIDVVNEVAYVVGESWSTDLVPPTPLTGDNDILVAAFNGDGALRDVALVGGTLGEQGNGIAADVDADDNGQVYLVGTTYSANFPLATNPGPAADETDAVVTRVGLETFEPDFAVYLGGGSDDDGRGIAVDTVGGLYITGSTASTDFPTTTGAYDTGQNGRSDGFVARLHLSSAAVNRVTYATYLGGKGDDAGYAAATDTGGHAFVAGATGGQGFPTTVGPTAAGDDDSFTAKVKVSQPPVAPAIFVAVSGSDARLTWTAVSGAGKYQVFRGSAPHFKLGEWGSALLQPEPTTGLYTDTDALLQADGYFYVVKSVSAAPEQASANSNQVGKFTYELVKGN